MRGGGGRAVEGVRLAFPKPFLGVLGSKVYDS